MRMSGFGRSQAANAPPATPVRHRGVLLVSFSADGRSLACGNQDGTITLFDARNGKQIASFQAGVNYGVYSLAFGAGLLASGSEDDTIKLWDPATQKEVRTFRGHTMLVTSLAFHLDGKRLLYWKL